MVFVDDGTFADYVIGENDGARAREFDGPVEIDGVIRLVGVEKDEVERA